MPLASVPPEEFMRQLLEKVQRRVWCPEDGEQVLAIIMEVRDYLLPDVGPGKVYRHTHECAMVLGAKECTCGARPPRSPR